MWRLIKNILTEIVVVAIQHSYDLHSSGVLPFKQLSAFMGDLLQENKPSAGHHRDLSILRPTMMHFTAEFDWDGDVINIPVSSAALRMSGEMENDKGLVSKASQQLENISNIYTAEIEKISFPSDDNSTEIRNAFSRALCQSPFVSMELRNVDTTLTEALLRNLPDTVQRLSVVKTPPERSTHFHQL